MAPFCSFGNRAVRMTAAVIAAKPMLRSNTSATNATAPNATRVMTWSASRLPGDGGLRAGLGHGAAAGRVSVPPEPARPGRCRRLPCRSGRCRRPSSSRPRRRDIKLATTEREEERDGDGEVEQQAGQEDGQLVDGQVVLGHDGVGDDPVDADRGEPAGLGAVHHEHAHHQRADAVAAGEAERDRPDDRAGRGAGGADGGEHGGHGEHHPGDQRDPAADRRAPRLARSGRRSRCCGRWRTGR